MPMHPGLVHEPQDRTALAAPHTAARSHVHIRNCSTLSMTVGVPLSVASGPANGAHSALRTWSTSASGPDTTKHKTTARKHVSLPNTQTQGKVGRKEGRRTVDRHGPVRRRDLLLEDPVHVRPAGAQPDVRIGLAEGHRERERAVRAGFLALRRRRVPRGRGRREVRRGGLLEHTALVRDERGARRGRGTLLVLAVGVWAGGGGRGALRERGRGALLDVRVEVLLERRDGAQGVRAAAPAGDVDVDGEGDGGGRLGHDLL